jgi:hypothetical protein
MKSLFRCLLILIPVIFAGCHHNADLNFDPPRPAPPPPGWKCSTDTVYFRNSVFPVVLSGCARTGCHDQTTHKSGHVLDNYADIYAMVNPFNPQQSKLYKLLYSNSNGRMPPDVPLNAEGKSIIYWWIKQGAFNNGCDSTGCDTLNVTWSKSVNPVIQNWCVTCHSGSNPGGGYGLETYDEVVACANSGRLMGAIRQEPGFSAMPKPGTMKLSTCEINLFAIWIRTGKPQ